ncbi:MAG: rRNA adenine N(6)-methyltransferase family protein [Lachnospiraceae bacterium]|nr:rRNA adenine N(6)-methyltransferase family protein [Lachnospiraceae bacterium]
MSDKNKGRRSQSAHLQEIAASQNFLTSRQLLECIVNRSTISKKDIVIEIGTGKGHLTDVLCKRCKYLYSIEIDRKLHEHTKKKLAHRKNLYLIYGDFLKFQLPQKGEYKVFANIPYYITTRIVRKLTVTSNPPAEMWLVMEKGAAKRFMGLPTENKYSMALKHEWRLEIIHYFKRADFHPLAAVDSVLLHFNRIFS